LDSLLLLLLNKRGIVELGIFGLIDEIWIVLFVLIIDEIWIGFGS
jgi:hypothetical protein